MDIISLVLFLSFVGCYDGSELTCECQSYSRVADKATTVYGANVIIFEGIFGLYDKKVLEMMVRAAHIPIGGVFTERY